MKHNIIISIFVFSFTVNSFYECTFAQDEVPCSHTEAKEFDFWLGEWDISWTDENGKTRYAENIVTKTLGECVIEENFSFKDETFAGKSFSVYNPNRKLWEQTWVDNRGGYMNFTGGMAGDIMILSRKTADKDGREIMQRMVFYNISENELEWNWERSVDGGQTWHHMWHLNYIRRLK